MIAVAAAVLISTALGVWARHRYGERAERATDRGMNFFLWVVLPPLAYLVIANLEIDSGVGAGIGFAYLALAVVALVALFVATRILALDRPSTGATVNASLMANTGYLGVPLAGALLGHDAVSPAVAFDLAVSALVSQPVGFIVGAAFGTKAGEGVRERAIAAFTRNPIFIAGVVALFVPDPLAPQAAADVAKQCFVLVLPVGFFLLGVHLMGEREDGTLQFPPPITKPIALTIALRLVVAPLLFVAATRLVDVPDAYLLQVAMPTGVLSVIVAHIYGLNLRLAASAVAWTTTIVIVAAIVAGLLA